MDRRVERYTSRLTTGVLPALLLIILLLLQSGCATQRRVIENPEIDDWDVQRMMHRNLFPSTYGYMEQSKYDQIDYRLPHEKADRKNYAFLSDPRGDINNFCGWDVARRRHDRAVRRRDRRERQFRFL